MKPLHEGASIGNFTILTVRELKEYNAWGIWARHEPTGLEVYHIAADEKENLFAFTFKTLPKDNSGVAHILEHSVLCGSKRFPLKDPFVLLLKGSMKTFMNAFTFPDRTVYPASSTVEEDLFNLMQVYGDAVFFPILSPEIFRQEGHRLEFNEEGKLELKGIVYNEMRGNYSSHDSIANEWSFRTLFPGTTYRFDSGGEPKIIPKLSYEEFLDFHRTYYHPSNTKVFFFGNIPTERYLDFLESQFLQAFDRLELDSQIPLQNRWSEPSRFQSPFPIGEGESAKGKSSVTLNWLLAPVDEPFRLLALELLSNILIGRSGSPLQKSLVESGLGEDLSAPSGIESELKEIVFSAGLRGTDPEREGDIESCIYNELERIRLEGFSKDLVEGTLRSVEFRNRELKGSPFGLRLMRRAMRGWIYGAAPETCLEFRPYMDRVRDALSKNPRMFEELTERYLIDNPHRSTVTIYPDSQLRKTESVELREYLEGIEKGLSEREAEGIREEQAKLKAWQERPEKAEDIAKIPFLTISDIPREIEALPTEQGIISDGVPLYTHDVFTNGIVYLDLGFSLRGIEGEETYLLPLMVNAIAECGLPDLSYDELQTRMSLSLGNFSGHLEANVYRGEPSKLIDSLFFRIKFLERSSDEALELLGRILLEADYANTARIRDVFKELKNDFSSAIIPSGHDFVSLRANRGLSVGDYTDEHWKGLSQYLFLSSIKAETDAPLIGEKLARLASHLIGKKRLMVNVTAEGRAIPNVLKKVENLICKLPEGEALPEKKSFLLPEGLPTMENFVVPSSVGFSALSLPASLLGTKEHAHESILAHLLRTGPLWEKIRMHGGAYGAFASVQGLDGIFSFASYRDPDLLGSLKAFSESLEEVAVSGLDPDSLRLAIIGTVGKELRPFSPGQKGAVAFRRILYGVSDDVRQQKREWELSTTNEDLKAAAGRILDSRLQGISCLMGGADAIEEAEARFPDSSKNRIDLVL